ncbi:hypothetical protein [Yinghuangia soli]|uniref:Uncharacterized protein n=1 Tax=Yinghuangia soli TaxID=2908204 RepID=A0AA41Q807_9ACTN|nr:hypothetical protein [Yinghuangia soli]MCF2532901.1 hypothetical protein [Yinghuangia soli]
MTADTHPLLRYADPATRDAAAERLRLAPGPEPEPPVPVDPEGVIARLRSGRGKDPRYVLDGVTVTDWDMIVREHRKAPLPDVIAAGLVARDDCPREAVLELVVARTVSRRGLATGTLANALLRGILTPHDVMFEAAPGWSALRVLEKYAVKHGDWLRPVRRVLTDAAELLPGDDPAAWQWLLTHGPRFPGTYPELCAYARTLARAGASAATAPAPDATGDAQATVDWDFGNPAGLLSRIRPSLAAKIIGMLPETAVIAFLETPDLPPSVIVPALRRAPAMRSRILRSADLGRAGVEALLALRDSDVNGALLEIAPQRADITLAIHRATRRDQPRNVPLGAAARRFLVNHHDPARENIATAVHGHYPQLIQAAFRQLGERLGTARALRGFLSLWECQGPDGVRAAAADPRLGLGPETRRIVQAALDAADRSNDGVNDPAGAAGSALLRAEVARHEHPTALIEAMREDPRLAGQPLPPEFWPVAVTAHARDPLPAPALARLAAQPGCPEALGLAACQALPELARTLGGRSRPYALTAIRDPLHLASVTWQTPRNAWYFDAIDSSLLSAEEFVELAHPVTTMLDALDNIRAILPHANEAAERHIAKLLHTALGDDPEAWTVTAHLMPDFVGTLPELLATVEAVTR